MRNYFKKNFSFISFLFIPIVYFWDPNWLEFLGVQPYWPLYWLLPWSIIYGSFDGLIIGLFLGLILDSLSLDSSFTQIPGLLLCGIWFGKLSISNNIFLGHLRFALICFIASFFCGSLYFFQAEDGIRDVERSRGLGDVYKRQLIGWNSWEFSLIGLYSGYCLGL